MDIVHPGYATNEYWYAKIDQSKVTVPDWEPLADLHPCDFQSSMLKKCTPANVDAADFYSLARRKRIRSIYYAMISGEVTVGLVSAISQFEHSVTACRIRCDGGRVCVNNRIQWSHGQHRFHCDK